MNRHSLTYIDLHPQPVQREPGPIRIWCGAALALLAVWCLTVFFFSL